MNKDPDCNSSRDGERKMKSRHIIPQEIKGYYNDDKSNIFSNLYFKWKVDLIYIRRNLKKCYK